jgi:hypothetical protein
MRNDTAVLDTYEKVAARAHYQVLQAGSPHLLPESLQSKAFLPPHFQLCFLALYLTGFAHFFIIIRTAWIVLICILSDHNNAR